MKPQPLPSLLIVHCQLTGSKLIYLKKWEYRLRILSLVAIHFLMALEVIVQEVVALFVDVIVDAGDPEKHADHASLVRKGNLVAE